MNFFVVSAGKPGSDYIDANYLDILDSKEFALHKDTRQKGTYFSIEENDVLILKYERKFVAYGTVKQRFENPTKQFSLRVSVNEWILFDTENSKNGVSRLGIQKATIGGGKQGAVKTVRPNFGVDKIKEINSAHPAFELILQLYKDSEANLQKEGDYFKLHEELFNFLLDKTESDAEFTFVVSGLATKKRTKS